MSSRDIGEAPIRNYRTRVRALLIANSGDNDGGVVGERFREHGWVFEQWVREDAGHWPTLPTDVTLVVSLGSDWSVYWDHVAGSVAAEARLLRAAHDSAVPTMGICFGGQMLAHALGGSVTRAKVPEIGWFPVKISQERAFIEQNVWFQWHYDCFSAPQDAAVLARGTEGCQAFVMGRSLGVQFHPEVTADIVARWSSGPGTDELARVGIDASDLRRETEAHAHMSREAGRQLVDWFIEHVSISPSRRGG